MAKKLFMGSLFLIALGIVSAWSYRSGLSVNQAFEAVKFMVMVREQHKCIEDSDLDCITKVNELMAGVTAVQLRRLDASALSDVDRKGIADYLAWEQKLRADEK